MFPTRALAASTTRGARRLSTSNIVAAAKATNGKEAEIRFGDGSAFAFHALWLRDSCRDAAHVEGEGERVLAASPLVSRPRARRAPEGASATSRAPPP